MLLNSHAICNAHEAVAVALIEQVTLCEIADATITCEVIDDAVALAKHAGFHNVIGDIHTIGEEYIG
jgi:hypothetical protein